MTEAQAIPVSAVAMANRIQIGELCPVDLVEATLERIRSADPAIFTELLEERALREAHAARQRRRAGNPLGPWDGVPIAWKDNFDIKGRVTTAGSVVRRSDAPAAQDADVVAHAARAGLVSIGCLNMTEFAYSGLGLNPHFGTPNNPHGTGAARIPGGSSSGCGVAVARGVVPLAIGTDTGGSVRIPAALNGVVGFMGARTAFSKRGVFPLSQTLDRIGPLAADVASCSGVADILNGRDVVPPQSAAINKLKFIIPTNVVFEGAQDAVVENFEASVRALEAAGATVTRSVLTEFDEIGALSEHGYMVGPEALDLLWDHVHSDDAGRMDPRIVDRILDAGVMSARGLIVIQRTRQRLIVQNRDRLADQIVLVPTTPVTAPEIAPLERGDDLYLRINKLMLRNTALGNFLDWCGVALPNGTDANRMPTSILMSMPGGREAHLLSAALAVEDTLSKTTNRHP